MEKIKNILGLWVRNGRIMDRFDWAFMASLGLVDKKLNSPEGICVEEEVGSLERRKKKLDGEEDKTYEKVLRQLAKLCPAYKKYLPKKKGSAILSDLLKRRMRLAIWVGTGNEIPFRDLNVVLLKNLLKEKGYAYRRNELRWYRGNQCVGKDLFVALEHLEKLEAVDRTRLTVSF
jgi:hypothetical protein